MIIARRPLFYAMRFFTLLPLHSCDFCKWLNALFKELLSLFTFSFVGLRWLSLNFWSPTRSEAIFWALSLGIAIASLLAEKSYVICFCCPFLCLLRHIFLFWNPTVLYILFGFGFGRLSSSPYASPPSSFRSSPDAFPPSLFSPTPRATAGGSVSAAYRTALPVKGCGNCVQKTVRAVRDIGWIASKNVEYTIRLHDRNPQTVANRLYFDAGLSHSTVVWGMWWFVRATICACGSWYRTSSIFELPIWLKNCRLIVTSIIMSGSEFRDNIGVHTISETLKRNQPTLVQKESPPPCLSYEQIWDSHV